MHHSYSLFRHEQADKRVDIFDEKISVLYRDKYPKAHNKPCCKEQFLFFLAGSTKELFFLLVCFYLYPPLIFLRNVRYFPGSEKTDGCREDNK